MDKWIAGEWWAICDICGMDYLASKLFLDYRGLRVCKQDLDIRNPQEFVRPVVEDNSVPWTRVENIEQTETESVAAAGDASPTTSEYILAIDPQGANVLCTFPATSGFTVNHEYVVMNKSSTYNVTFAVNPADTFQGSTTLLPNTSARIRSVRTNHIWVRDQ